MRTFVDLTTPEDRLEPYAVLVDQAATARGVILDHVRFPIPDGGVVEDDRYDDVLDLIAHGQRTGAVYVHCWGGVGRTGTVIGSVLAAAGADHAEVMRRLDDLRAGTRKARRACPENELQQGVLARRCRPGRGH
ncbi:MAG: tyrosine-protein phosphatase [Actinomycetota bacterium]|nr:tyrosine-protein phosphatase [Actinomycetota bacterium]